MSKRKRNFRVSDEEWEIIKCKATSAGMKPCTYVRRMAVEGKLKKYDMKIVNDVRLEMYRIGTNLEQISKIVSQSNPAYNSDMEELKKEYIKMKNTLNKWLKPFD